MTMDRKQRTRGTTLWDHLAILMKWRKLVLAYMTVMAIAAVVYALVVQTWFTSSARVLPPPADEFGLSSLLPSMASGAMGLAGFLSNESNLMMTVLESRSLADSTISRFNWIEEHELPDRQAAYERYWEVFSWEVNEDGSIGLMVEEISPELARTTLSYILDEVLTKYNKISTTQAHGQRVFIERRLDQAYDDLAKLESKLTEFQRETGVIEVESQLEASFGALAEIQAQLILAEVQLEVAKSTLPPTSSEVLMAKRQVEALRNRLAAINKRVDSEQHEMIIGVDYAPDVVVPYLRMVRELELQQTILEFLLPLYEQSRINEQREKPNVYVLDTPDLPDKKSKPRRAFLVLAWLFVAFLLLYAVLAFVEWVRRLREVDPEQYELVTGVLERLKPARFFARDDEDPARPERE